MFLTKLTTSNFLGLPSFSVTFAPLTVFAGPNGAGKSSIRDAIAFVLDPNGVRGAKRIADLSTLLTRHTEKGYVEADIDGRTIRRKVTDAKIGSVPMPALPECLPWILDPGRFAADSAADKRSGLSLLLQVDSGPKEIRKRLLKAGVTEATVDALAKDIARGFPDAEKRARELATEARGAWKGITGANYGSNVGETWAPAPIEGAPSPEAVLKVLEDKRALESEIGGLNQKIGAASRQPSAADRELWQAWAAKLDGYLKSETRGRDLMDGLEQELLALPKAGGGNNEGTTTPCPHCGKPVVIDRGHLRAYTEEASNEALDAAEQARAGIKAKIEDARGKLAGVRDAIRMATEYKNKLDLAGEGTAEDVTALRADLDAKQARLSTLVALAADYTAKANESARNDELPEKAKREHDKVVQFSLAADQLSPNGIPALLLADVLDPINADLAAIAATCGWPPVRIDGDMDLFYDEIPYRTLSESQRWRVDAALCRFFVKRTGFPLLLLDRFDVLDVPSRGPVLKWLFNESNGGLQVVLLGTLKAPLPAREGMASVWLDASVTGVAPKDAAA